MRNPFTRILARLSVGRKLLLIYLLDLTAVIFVSGILINEKYIAINFARDELRGNAYIGALRDALIDSALLDPGLPDRAGTLTLAEQRHGAAMGTGELNQSLLNGTHGTVFT